MLATTAVLLWIFLAVFGSVSHALNCPYPVTNAVAHPQQQQAQTGQVILTWTAPTTNEDDSPLTDLGGYSVYTGPDAASLSFLEDVADPAAVTHQLTLPTGITYFGMTAWDTEDPRNESVMSNIVSKEIQ